MAIELNRIRGKRSQKTGEFGENMVRAELDRQGYQMVQRVHTPYKLLYGQPDREGKRHLVKAFPVEKVNGDFIAITRQGRFVLVESKARDGERLRFSVLADHQVKALDNNHFNNGLSVLAWVRPDIGEVKLFRWPVDGFIKGTSLPWEKP